MKIFYIILAILGIVLPYWAMFASIFIDQYTVRQFFSAWFENNAVRMIAADLGVAGTTFSAYIIYSFKQGNGPRLVSTAVSWQSEFYRLIHADSRVVKVADSRRKRRRTKDS